MTHKSYAETIFDKNPATKDAGDTNNKKSYANSHFNNVTVTISDVIGCYEKAWREYESAADKVFDEVTRVAFASAGRFIKLCFDTKM